MNDEFDNQDMPGNRSIDTELQVRLMNLVLGEASDFERDQLQLLMEQRPELAAYHQHLQHMHGLLCDVGLGESAESVSQDEEAWQLPADKRHELLAVIDGKPQRQPEFLAATNWVVKKKFVKPTWWAAAVAVVAACVMVALLLPAVQSARVSLRRDEKSAYDVVDYSDYFIDNSRSKSAAVPAAPSASPALPRYEYAKGIDANKDQDQDSALYPRHPQGYTVTDSVWMDLQNKVSPSGDDFRVKERLDVLGLTPAEPRLPPVEASSGPVSGVKSFSEASDIEAKSALAMPDPDSLSYSLPNEGVGDTTKIVKDEALPTEGVAEIERRYSVKGFDSNAIVSRDKKKSDRDSASVSNVDAAEMSFLAIPQTPQIMREEKGEISVELDSPYNQSTRHSVDTSALRAPAIGTNEWEVLAKQPAEELSGKNVDGKGLLEQLRPGQDAFGLEDVQREFSEEFKKRSKATDGRTLEKGSPVESTIGAAGDRELLKLSGPSAASPSTSTNAASPSVSAPTDSARRFRSGSDRPTDQPPENWFAENNGRGWMFTPTLGLETGSRWDRREAAPTNPERKPAAKPSSSLDEQSASAEPFSTFSLHVSDVSFKLAQFALAQGQWPEAAKIRIEEFVNAIDYHDPLPGNGERVSCRAEQAIHPFLMQRNLLRISMRTAASGRSSNTPLRLTMLLDNSGSMERPDRRQAVVRAFEALTKQLNPADQITLISFASTPRLLADKVHGDQSETLLKTVENLPSEGGTNIEAALMLAREKAMEQQTAGAQNRIVLLTDGAVNLGNANPASLAKIVTQLRDSGIAFDAAGISALDLNDEVLEALTRQGDGRYYLLDSLETVSDSFAAQIAGALRPSAQNVKVQVEFNPGRVGRYKLLGFEKHRLNKEDFRNDKVDAAELAAAEAGVAVYQYEIKPNGSGDVGNVSVRFRDLESGQMVERRWPIPYETSTPRLDQAQPSMQLAAAAALFAAKLSGGPLADGVDLAQLQKLLVSLPDEFVRQPRVAQLRTMVEQAQRLTP